MKDNNIISFSFNVSEIFYSIQGESSFAGLPTVFIRLQGCNMRCVWCDTGYALDVKQQADIMTIDDILQKIKSYPTKLICVTGGEPLMQKDAPYLLNILCDEGFTVSLETNGHYLVNNIDSRVHKILDFKCPDSKMEKLNNFDNINYLNQNDEVKFVIASRLDYEWTKEIINKYNLTTKVNNVLLSSVFSELAPAELAQWILEDALPVRFQLQLHKYIWEPNTRGV